MFGTLKIGRKSEGAMEMASAKGADSTKSTTFGPSWCSLHVGVPTSQKSRKTKGALEMASSEGAGSTKSTTFGLLWVPSPFRTNLGTPRSGIYSSPPLLPKQTLKATELAGVHNSGGALEMLQNRQLLCFCGGSLHFGGPRSRKSSKSKGALEMASAKGAGSTKSTTFLELIWVHHGVESTLARRFCRNKP